MVVSSITSTSPIQSSCGTHPPATSYFQDGAKIKKITQIDIFIVAVNIRNDITGKVKGKYIYRIE